MVKKIKKKEELPSFLLKVISRPKELDEPPEEVPNEQYLGPVFFGGCHQYHPNPHSLNLRSTLPIQFNDEEAENILKSILIPKCPTPRKSFHVEPFQPRVKKRKEFVDHYLHRCPGQRKAFVPEVVPPVIDFGETTSIIYGETSREIPMCRLKDVCSRTSHEEFEIVTLSDIREKKRMFMSPQERAAHAHFLKQFATVRVIGPTIPAAITITKIPSKRKRLSDVSISSKIRKTVEDESRKDDTIQKEEKIETTPEAHVTMEKVVEETTTGDLEEEGVNEGQEMNEAEEEDIFEEDGEIIGEEDEQTIEEPFPSEEERGDAEEEEVEEPPEE